MKDYPMEPRDTKGSRSCKIYPEVTFIGNQLPAQMNCR